MSKSIAYFWTCPYCDGKIEGMNIVAAWSPNCLRLDCPHCGHFLHTAHIGGFSGLLRLAVKAMARRVREKWSISRLNPVAQYKIRRWQRKLIQRRLQQSASA